MSQLVLFSLFLFLSLFILFPPLSLSFLSLPFSPSLSSIYKELFDAGAGEGARGCSVCWTNACTGRSHTVRRKGKKVSLKIEEVHGFGIGVCVVKRKGRRERGSVCVWGRKATKEKGAREKNPSLCFPHSPEQTESILHCPEF